MYTQLGGQRYALAGVNTVHGVALELATSPYMTGDCCTDDGKTWRSTIDTTH